MTSLRGDTFETRRTRFARVTATAPGRKETRDWQPVEGEPATATTSPRDDRQYAMLLHLSALAGFLFGGLLFLGPLIMWLIRKDQSPFVDRHGRAAVDFHISLLIYGLAATLLLVVVAVATLGLGILLLIPAIIVGALLVLVLTIVFPILAALKANDGLEYRYPLAIPLLQRRQ